MKIKLQDLADFSTDFLDILSYRDIYTAKDLRGLIKGNYYYKDRNRFFTFSEREVNGKPFYVLRYNFRSNMDDMVTPIGLEVNFDTERSGVIVLAQKKLEGYSFIIQDCAILIDTFRNKTQKRVIPSSDFGLCRDELKRLSKMR
ncbi:hypothetical protein HYW74_04310 [Candidatus Pacearchaeota archaeon]|nr:hypothetical protein [Candidatus Pacearchaeota archaeon]